MELSESPNGKEKTKPAKLEPRDKVLLVEDFKDTVTIIRMLLEKNGYDVATALSLAEARKQIRTTIPDVIILDINLPDGSGLDFLQELRDIQPDIPVIMLTAYTELDNAVRSLQQGVNDFIPKPFDNNYLVHSVGRAVEKRKLQERVRKSEKFRAVAEMAAGVAHDFNNLLHSMATHIYLMLKDTEIIKSNREHLDALKTAVDDASEIVKRLHTMGMAGNQDLQVVDLASLVNDTLMMTKPKWYHKPRQTGRSIEVETSLEKDIYIKVNPSEIREVLTNIIFNAVDAMPSGGTISISTHKEQEKAVCILKDNGIGISPELIDRIFDPFFTTKGHGSGLGLSISYAIIEKHGGQMSVKSTPGKGTTFIITLPCIEGIRF